MEQKLNSTVQQHSIITKPRKKKTDTLFKPLLPPSEHIITTPKRTSTENTQVCYKRESAALYVQFTFFFIFFIYYCFFFLIIILM